MTVSFSVCNQSPLLQILPHCQLALAFQSSFKLEVVLNSQRRNMENIYERSFRAEWCQQYSWLHYDVSLDAAFCYLCMRAEHEGKFLVSTKREPSFLSKGYTNWKEAKSTFKKHQTSASHLEALEAVVTLPKQILVKYCAKKTRK